MTVKRHLLLERLASGELPNREAFVLTDEEREELSKLDAENRQLLRDLPAADVAAEVHRRVRVERVTSEPSRASRLVRLAPIALAPIAAVVIAVVVARPAIDPAIDPTQPRPDVEVTRVKGDARLAIFRQRTHEAERLSAASVLAPGDVLQLRYEAGAARFGAIVSIDGAGQVTMHLPRDPSASAAELDPAGAALPSAYELDAAPRFERFFFVTSPTPFSASVVERAARQLASSALAETAPLPLDRSLESTALLLRKEK